MEETWKDIQWYDGYQISNLGRVKSFKYNKEKILRPKNVKQYLIVSLCKQGKVKNYLVHRLVAEAFIPNPQNLPQVNHIDEDKTNNCMDNLEWCDAKYNSNYGTRNEKISKQVLCVETGIIYPSTMEIKRKLGFVQSNISMCCNGKRKTAYGHTWRYV